MPVWFIDEKDGRKKINCFSCGKDRNILKYSANARKGYSNPVCTNCRYPKYDYQIYKPNPKLNNKKKLPCLVCGKEFLTVPKIRTCSDCSKSETYKDGYIEYGITR